MRALIVAALFLPSAARAVEPSLVRACVKWSKDIPEAQAAGAGRFLSVARVEGKGPHASCGVVAETESFGVGWLMRAWMKEGVFSPCGERLGGYTVHYKGEEWQAKVVVGLHEFLTKNPGALTSARKCAPAPAATPAPSVPPAAPPAATPAAPPAAPAIAQPVVAPVEISTRPLTPSLAAPIPSAPLPPAAPPGGEPPPTIISQPAVAPVRSSTAAAPSPAP